MKRTVLGLIGLSAVAMSISGCDGDNVGKHEPDVVYETNNMVVHEDTDECPRADGQPCK